MLEAFDLDTPFPILADFIDPTHPDVAEWVRRCRVHTWQAYWVIGVHWSETGWGTMTQFKSPRWLLADSEEEILRLSRAVIEQYLAAVDS